MEHLKAGVQMYVCVCERDSNKKQFFNRLRLYDFWFTI